MKNVVALACLLCALSAPCQQLSKEEREFVIGMLEENSDKFLAEIEKISESQWKYRPSVGQWSIAEILTYRTFGRIVTFDRPKFP